MFGIRPRLHCFGHVHEARGIAFDMRVFFFTMRTELRRELHPELYTDQFYFPEQGLDAHRMLLRYIEQWCLEIEKASQEDEDD